MSVAIFDSKRDTEIIGTGTGGFLCLVCLQAKPADEQSSDERYCLTCREILQADKTAPAVPDTWSHDNAVFTHYGRRYVLSPGLLTICLENPSDGVSEVLQGLSGKESARHKSINEVIDGSGVTQKSVIGRPPLDLPVEKVLELSGAGRSIREIADEVLVNRETVRRIISGERVLEGVR